MNPATVPDPAQLPLRDIHLPEPVSWWPPAPGWWLLLAILLTALGFALGWWLRRRQRRVLRELLGELDAIERQHRHRHDTSATVQQLSVLLRRAALSFHPRREVAGLTGPDWLDWLDRIGRSRTFSTGVGALLDDSPYRPADQTVIDEQQMQELFRLVRDTLQQVWRSRHR
jgi:hypothetical protein